MLAALRTLLTKWFQSPPKAIETAATEQKPSIPEFLLAHHEDDDQPSHLVPYDENLLERARTQWQFGDWQSLAKIDRDTLQHHPDRAKLALLAAAGRLQTGQDAEAKAYIRLAQDWGVSKKLISQILIAGVHNSIGRAAAIGNQQHRALQHFENAIQIGTPGADAKLLTQARAGEQLSQLGLPTPEGYLKVGAGGTATTEVKDGKDQKTLNACQSYDSDETRKNFESRKAQTISDSHNLNSSHIDARIENLDLQLSAIEAEREFLRKQKQSKYYSGNDYNAKRYWNDRHAKYRFDMRGVGNRGLSEEDNKRMYEQAKNVFLALCEEQHIILSDSKVLDIGCGTGFYANVLQSNGVTEYVGIDISGVLLEELRIKYPSYDFREVDVAEEQLSESFDVIIMIDVTQHIVSTEKFSYAMQNIKKALRDSGVFIVTSWLNSNIKNSFYERSRVIDDYLNEFDGWSYSEPMSFRDKYIFSIRRYGVCNE